MKRFSSIVHRRTNLLPELIVLFVAICFGLAINIFPPFYIAILILSMIVPLLVIQPKFMVYTCISIVLFFPDVGWGVLDPKNIFNIYAKGSGILYYSLVNIFLWMTFLSTMLQRVTKDTKHIPCNLYKYFWAFTLLFLFFILWGIGTGVSFLDITSNRGVLNVINMIMLVYIMLSVFRTADDLKQLTSFFIASMVARGLWGIVRFAFFGGDIANPYASLGVNLTFFDIGDGLIACIAIFYASWVLIHNYAQITRCSKLLYFSVVSIGLFNIMFSQRRTGWIGLLLAAIWLVISLPKSQRLRLAITACSVFIPIFAIVSRGRFASNGGSGSQRFFSDLFVRGHFSFTEGRFSELFLAINTIKNNFFFGVGPWGDYQNISSTLWGLDSNFTHSAIVHMWLKTGLIGLSVFIAILYGYIHFWIKNRNDIEPSLRGIAEASFSGFLFFIPDILFGTPIIEYRHMILLGFCISVPYIVYFCATSATKANAGCE